MKTYKQFINEKYISKPSMINNTIMKRIYKLLSDYGLPEKFIQNSKREDDIDLYHILKKIKKDPKNWKVLEDTSKFTRYSFKGIIFKMDKDPLGLTSVWIN